MPERLKGKKILVTRPEEQAQNLCRLIENEGGVAIRLPVIDIQPVEVDSGLREYLSRISSYDIGIFVSQNAVKWTLDLLGKDFHVLNELKIVAIGKSTARLLQEEGINDIGYTEGIASSETLLELPVFSNPSIKGSRVIIFRGVGGREYLADRLTEKGAYVDYAEVYRRQPSRHGEARLEKIFIDESPDFIVVTSTEGLQNLFDMLSSKQRNILLNTQLLVLGDRMAKHALKLGFSKKPIIADETTDRGLLRTIIQGNGESDK